MQGFPPSLAGSPSQAPSTGHWRCKGMLASFSYAHHFYETTICQTASPAHCKVLRIACMHVCVLAAEN